MAALDKDAALAMLSHIRSSMAEQFADPPYGVHAARLEQLDHLLNTTVMVIGHLYDEDLREQDFRLRMADAPRQVRDQHRHQMHPALQELY